MISTEDSAGVLGVVLRCPRDVSRAGMATWSISFPVLPCTPNRYIQRNIHYTLHFHSSHPNRPLSISTKISIHRRNQGLRRRLHPPEPRRGMRRIPLSKKEAQFFPLFLRNMGIKTRNNSLTLFSLLQRNLENFPFSFFFV